MKHVGAVISLLLFVVCLAYAASWTVITSQAAVPFVNTDTVTAKTQKISDSAKSQRWLIATTGAVHGTVRVYTYSGGTAGVRSARFVTLDSISESGPYVKLLGPLTLDSLMEMDLPDKPKNPGHSAVKQISDYFAYRLEFHAKGSGNTSSRLTFSIENP